jgi:1,4-dihydroxy-2-naphthoate octaprenyltransferase
MKPAQELLPGLEQRGYTHAVIAFIDADGYPLSVATAFHVDAGRGVVVLDAVAGDNVAPPLDREVNVVFSHIRPQPGYGYDERRYVSFWGHLRPVNGHLELEPEAVQHWDEQEMSFFEYSERGVPQAHRYMGKLSEELGRPIKPRLSPGWLFLRATRLPFLSATIIPVMLGVAIAAYQGEWHWIPAVLTLIAASFIHLGLNVANDVFDTTSGADEANVNPTQFSGGSRVILYGLLSLRQMALMAAGFYAAGLGIGLFLAIWRDFWPIFTIGVIGLFVSLAYTAPPFRLVHRGVGEVMVGLGFGPIVTLGAYWVQTRGFHAPGGSGWEAIYASIPVAIFIALVLYVNEIPDRPGDAAAGKRTLPVRLSKEAVIALYAGAVAVAFGLILGGAVSGVLVRPAILALAGIPLALTVYRGLKAAYDNPYALMPTMAKNIQLHTVTGALLVLGYVIAIIAGHNMAHPPVILR